MAATSAFLTLTLIACGGGTKQSEVDALRTRVAGLEATVKPTETPIPEVKQNSVIFLKGLDTMKITKDIQQNPLSLENKSKVAKLAKELGVTHLTVDTPYDNASGTDTIKDTKE